MLDTSSFCLKYLLLFSIALTANSLPTSAQTSPPHNSGLLSTSGAKIATVTGKDVVHPSLSPNSKFLAYSEVLVQKGKENTSISVLNLETQQKFTLIDAKTAAKYATYRAYVSDMKWSRADRLTISISDGDVDTTKLTFDPQTRKLISSKNIEAGGLSDEEVLELKARKQLAERILKIFPKINRSVLTSEIESDRAFSIDDTVSIQGQLFDREDNFWIINLTKKSVKKLFKAGDPLAKTSLDKVGRVGKKSMLFTLTADRSAPILFRYDSGRVKQIGRLSGLEKLNRPIKVVYNSPQKTILIGYVYNTYEQGNNLLYTIEKGRIVKSTAYVELYDVHVNADGTRIAYCYWSKGKRQITVRELS
jgi:hypothetical protein